MAFNPLKLPDFYLEHAKKWNFEYPNHLLKVLRNYAQNYAQTPENGHPKNYAQNYAQNYALSVFHVLN